MTIDIERVQRRVAARKQAHEIVELASDSAEKLDKEAAAVFWGVLRDTGLKHAPLPPAKSVSAPVVPMTDAEAMEFGEQRMGFGKWAGSLVENVPLKYLDWLVGQPDVFKGDVERYLHNPRIAEALADELEGD
jgi:uncharacterized protein (DUF3820 family)